MENEISERFSIDESWRGRRHGKLTVAGAAFSLGRSRKHRRRQFVVAHCDCGSKIVALLDNIVRRNSGCGCMATENAKKHGHKRGTGASRTYKTWTQMISRCTNEKAHNYRLYGGRGISICERWLNSFAAFLEDVGDRPEGKSLDRIDVNGNYEPGNVRWATQKEQCQNRRPRAIHSI